jgi:DNA polymerase-3 subunit delta
MAKRRQLAQKKGAACLAKQIYCFYGDEELLIEERVNEFKKKVNDPELNIEIINADKPDFTTILAALQTPPLLFGDKLLIIKGADFKNEGWQQIEPALENLEAGLIVLFLPSAVDKRSRFFKTVDRLGETCEFRTFADWEQEAVAAWIIQRFKNEEKNCERQAAFRLQEICGNNLLKLSNEIAKIVTYLGEKKQVSCETIEALASAGQISIFALAEAVGERDLPAALAAFKLLLRDKEEPVVMLGMIINRWRLMLLGKTEKNQSKVVQSLGGSPYYIKRCFAQSVKFNKPELERGLELILATDLKIKSGEPAAPLFEVLLTTLCLPGKMELVNG